MLQTFEPCHSCTAHTKLWSLPANGIISNYTNLRSVKSFLHLPHSMLGCPNSEVYLLMASYQNMLTRDLLKVPCTYLLYVRLWSNIVQLIKQTICTALDSMILYTREHAQKCTDLQSQRTESCWHNECQNLWWNNSCWDSLQDHCFLFFCLFFFYIDRLNKFLVQRYGLKYKNSIKYNSAQSLVDELDVDRAVIMR